MKFVLAIIIIFFYYLFINLIFNLYILYPSNKFHFHFHHLKNNNLWIKIHPQNIKASKHIQINKINILLKLYKENNVKMNKIE